MCLKVIEKLSNAVQSDPKECSPKAGGRDDDASDGPAGDKGTNSENRFNTV